MSKSNDLCMKTVHPMTGDPLWLLFSCGSGFSFPLVQEFLDLYEHDNYSLSICNTLGDSETVEVDVSLEDMFDVITLVYNLEHAEPIRFIGVNSLSNSYVIGMSLSKGRIHGCYKYMDGKLVHA